ncbi:hypothetical protein CBR_g3394 [Chara braunii]|uniref:Uncharacterized protein n=1 Tax=Chara braunii TaxID=69332 RepID=A0A388JQU4_CHABU|nr:hypothetical protein CBR_g3394 [Chara braunii]|eukprot:GBG60151.1 hypothetical protein CBR_g3394 [Chara braunii]
MSPETHIRLAELFRPCARSVRYFNGVTTIHGATAEDFDEDPLMTVIPCMGRHIDGWCDGNWATMESRCPWASQYKFANMLEFGNLMPVSDAVLGHKFLKLGCISRHFSRLECHYVRSSPRTWGGPRKQELVDCARHCSFLEQYPLWCPENSPQAVSYCCVRLTVSGTDFARVLCIAASNMSRKLVDAVMLVSRNEVVIEGSKFVRTRGPEIQQPCGPVIFVEANKRRRVLGAVLWWENAKDSRRWFYMKNVYGSKGNVVAGAKGAVLDMCLFEGFGAGAANTPFCNDLRQQGGFVLGREFFDLLEDKDIALDVPCEVGPDLELSMPLQPCGGCESSGAAGERGDLGSGEATHVQREDARGQLDNSEDEVTPAPPFSSSRERDRSVLSIPGVRLQTPVRQEVAADSGEEAVQCGSDLEPAEGHDADDKGGEGAQGRGDCEEDLDNKKDLKAPPRQLKLSMKDIRWQWKHDGCPRAVMGNPSGKQDQVRAWRKFCTTALHKAPHNNLWILADQKEEETLKKQNAALRSYFPLPMAGKNVWKLAVEFFEKWETGRLLSHDGAKWIVKKKKVKNVKPGVAYIHNDKLGRTEVVYNVPVDPPNKKGKKEKEEGDWFVQVPDPDAHCWKAMESLTDNEKCRVLKKVLACEAVWVQAGSPSLPKLGKLSVQDMVQLVKCNRVLVPLWNYYQFKHEKRPNWDWIQRLKSREVTIAEGIVHIKWKDTGDATSIAPFANDPLEADIRGAELKEAVAAIKSHTFVLDLCELVDLKLWKAQAWETLDSYLQTWCPSHWTLVVFVPQQHNLTFLASMHHLSFVKLLEGKWVRRVQQKKSFPIGNNLYTEEDRMYILFKGDDLRANTSVVYEGNLPWGAAAAVRLPQRVTQTDVCEIPFVPCDWSLVVPERQGNVYGDMECNPIQFVGLLDFLGKKGEGVMFLGEPHAQSVWDLLKAGRHVVAMEGNTELLQFTMQMVKSEVNSGGHNSEFMVVKPTRDKVWSNKTDMWFKLSERKRNKIYDFLFFQTRSRKDSDAEYVRRKDHMLALLDNYHFASGMNAKTFLDRLQSSYYVESEELLKSGEPSKDPEIGSIAARDGNVGKVSPEQERRPQGLQQEAASTGSGDMETTKSAEIRTSSGGGCRPGIVVPLRGAACTETEGRFSGFSTYTTEGDEFRGRKVGEKMEERRGAQKGEEEGEEEEEGEKAGETELLGLLEEREGA